MSKRTLKRTVPLVGAGLAALLLGGCSTYGAGDYGYYGRGYPNASYRAPYTYGRGSIFAAPYGYDRGHAYGSRGYSSGHNGFGHLGGRRH